MAVYYDFQKSKQVHLEADCIKRRPVFYINEKGEYFVFNSTKIICSSDDTIIHAFDSSFCVITGSGGKLKTYNKSCGLVFNNTECEAYNHSSIECHDNSCIDAFNKSVIKCYDNSTVSGFHSSFIAAKDNTIITLFHESTLDVCGVNVQYKTLGKKVKIIIKK